MKYSATKRKYFDSILVLIIGVFCLAFLGRFLEPKEAPVLPLPKINIDSSLNEFVYAVNTPDSSIIQVFNINTLKNKEIYATNENIDISSASFLQNHLLYTHGSEDFIIDARTRKLFESHGNYISPNGKQYLSIGEPEKSNSLLTFSIVDQDGVLKETIQSKSTHRQLHKILGWSSDSERFYFSTRYSITKSTPMQDTDRWMQKVGNEIKEMSRVRTWMKHSTTSAQMVYQVDTVDKIVSRMFTNTKTNVIRNVFFNPKTDVFYLITDANLYTIKHNDLKATPSFLKPKIATQVAEMVFATQDNTNRFLYSDGKGLSLADPDKEIDKGIYYASESATLSPLALTNNYVLFALEGKKNYSGQIIDLNKLIQTEFLYQEIGKTKNTSLKPILFGGWMKDVSVNFSNEPEVQK